jgi:hypothetical protein
MRCGIPDGFVEWWRANLSSGTHIVSGLWRSADQIELGRLRADKDAFRADPRWIKPDGSLGNLPDFVDRKNRIVRALGQAFTRAGWQRPRVDPVALETLLELRNSHKRLEFVLDTNAMVDGMAHWLVEHFADRADLVVTAVSLRELQDQHHTAQFSADLPTKAAQRGDVLSARQAYLAANRMRELLSSRTVLWRELSLDDTALLLSRGPSGAKSSEADTTLLRAVRQSILDRVNGLERYFVTADVALARRATSELPTGSVIASQVREIVPGRVYLPCWWWPGPDQGRGIARSTPRLVWELLAMFDQVDVLHESSEKGWTFRAFDTEMWPSDYASPWVWIQPYAPSQRSVSALVPKPSASSAPPSAPSNAPRSVAAGAASVASAAWNPAPPNARSLDHNFRLAINSVLDTLAKIAFSRTNVVKLDLEAVETNERRRHLAQYFELAGLATISEDGRSAIVGPQREALARVWEANDLDGVFDLLRVWAPLDEQATMIAPPERPEATIDCARTLAARLGQVTRHGSAMMRGGLRPDVQQIRRAIRDAFARLPLAGPSALPAYSLLTEVFLEGLGVSPARVIQAWEQLTAAGAFSDIEFRSGGTSSGRNVQEVVRLVPGAWSLVRLDLEAVHGYRDLVLRSSTIG